MKISSAPEATITQLQALVELDKASLAREIHDDLGGFLIASAMDLTNLRHRFAGYDEDARRKFDRLSKMLNGAIDMMRRVTEELHPTLLDNVGLFAALRWQMKHLCNRSRINCIENFPDAEPQLSQAAAISLYRIGQEALVIAENHPDVHELHFNVATDRETLQLDVATDGAPGERTVDNRRAAALGFLRHRVAALGGKINLDYPEAGGMKLSVDVLLAKARACR